MRAFKQKNNVRDLKDGDWYWIPKAVIHRYTPKVGAIGIAVYNFLASLANQSQSCFPSQKYIAEHLGYSRSYVNQALRRLEKAGLIKVEKKGRYHRTYHLLEVRCKHQRTQVSTTADSGVKQDDTNNNKLTRNINNIDNKRFLKFSSKEPEPRTKKELVALDLAEVLNDVKGYPFYLSCAKKYPESILRKILGEVKEVPSYRIKKSRAALFNHLVKKYAQKTSHHHRD